MNGITPFLWFNDQAEEAARFYVSLFRGSRITHVGRVPGSEGEGPDRVQTVSFELAGQSITALNGGPIFQLTPAFSLFVRCSSQGQVDALWARLTKGGQESRCGWLVDRFGVSWQIVPERLLELLSDPDPARSGRAQAAMMTMAKIDLRALEEAAGPRTTTRRARA
ncbi:MAG TPA: VOC family protein [Thermoplasmata archaeon]|nr:VOC family protein [Thermoplasmata archaeon]